MIMNLVEVKEFSFAYPECSRKVLDHANLKIEEGTLNVICGRSGCGKSTLLRQLKTVLAPVGKSEGEIFYRGMPLSGIDHRTQSQEIGFVMQNPDNQIVTDKVWHELSFGLESLGYDNATIRLRVAEMASYFGIHQWFYKNVSELSGGQKQILNLAAIMAMHPSLLILDEPTSQLDPIAASDFLGKRAAVGAEQRRVLAPLALGPLHGTPLPIRQQEKVALTVKDVEGRAFVPAGGGCYDACFDNVHITPTISPGRSEAPAHRR